MTGKWTGSNRRDRLPSNWKEIRSKVLLRDNYRCRAVDEDIGARCGRFANQVDHIIPGPDHGMSNLRSLCSWHHSRKSSTEGNASKKRYTKRRSEEQHPGVISQSGVGEFGRPRCPHKSEIVGSNPTPASKGI